MEDNCTFTCSLALHLHKFHPHGPHGPHTIHHSSFHPLSRSDFLSLNPIHSIPFQSDPTRANPIQLHPVQSTGQHLLHHHPPSPPRKKQRKEEKTLSYANPNSLFSPWAECIQSVLQWTGLEPVCNQIRECVEHMQIHISRLLIILSTSPGKAQTRGALNFTHSSCSSITY